MLGKWCSGDRGSSDGVSCVTVGTTSCDSSNGTGKKKKKNEEEDAKK